MKRQKKSEPTLPILGKESKEQEIGGAGGSGIAARPRGSSKLPKKRVEDYEQSSSVQMELFQSLLPDDKPFSNTVDPLGRAAIPLPPAPSDFLLFRFLFQYG